MYLSPIIFVISLLLMLVITGFGDSCMAMADRHRTSLVTSGNSALTSLLLGHKVCKKWSCLKRCLNWSRKNNNIQVTKVINYSLRQPTNCGNHPREKDSNNFFFCHPQNFFCHPQNQNFTFLPPTKSKFHFSATHKRTKLVTWGDGQTFRLLFSR